MPRVCQKYTQTTSCLNRLVDGYGWTPSLLACLSGLRSLPLSTLARLGCWCISCLAHYSRSQVTQTAKSARCRCERSNSWTGSPAATASLTPMQQPFYVQVHAWFHCIYQMMLMCRGSIGTQGLRSLLVTVSHCLQNLALAEINGDSKYWQYAIHYKE